jgi:hypothetical protein
VKANAHKKEFKTHKGKLKVLKEKLATCQGRPKCHKLFFEKPHKRN